MLYNSRDLLYVESEEILNNYPIDLEVQFDDGVIVPTKRRHIVYSKFFWEFHKRYPGTPLLSQHLVTTFKKDKALEFNTHIDLLTIITKDVCIHNNLYLPEDKDYVMTIIYDITNKIYNFCSQYAEEDVISIDIMDFIQIQNHPEVKKVTDNIEPTYESITKAYKEVNRITNTDLSFKENGVIKAIRSKSLNANQMNQCIVVRGFSTEVTGKILSTPIMTCYSKGMRKLYDFAAESRSAAKAYFFAEAPLQDSEYFARRLQLLCMTVERIAYVDCGSKKYINWYLKGPAFDERGNQVYPGDLKFMIGKNYLDESSNQIVSIKGDETHLYGKTIKLRSVIHCQHSNPHEVCHVCFGELHHNVSPYANLGHLCCATMTQQTSQSVLSTKHLDANSANISIVLSEENRRFFNLSDKKDEYVLKPNLAGKDIELIIPRDSASGIIDLLELDDLKNISISRVSQIEMVDISYYSNGMKMHTPLVVSQGKRMAMFTMEFLSYIKENRWTTDERNNYVFNLKDFPKGLPIMKLPNMEYSFSDHSHQVETLIESTAEELSKRTKPEAPVVVLQELFSLVNSKLNVNIAALEVIIYANMTPSANQYGMARNYPNAGLNVSDKVIESRSLGPAYTYEKHATVMLSPRSFFKEDRPSSVLDVFMAPKEVVEERRRKGLIN